MGYHKPQLKPVSLHYEKKISLLFATCLMTAHLLASDPTWDTETILLSTSTEVKNAFTSVAEGPNTGEAIAAWPDDTTSAPYYSIFSDGTWTTSTIPLSVPEGTTSSGVSNFVYLSPGPNSGNVMATWADPHHTSVPFYSIYSSGTWTTGNIPIGSSLALYSDVTSAAGPATGQMTVTWTDNDYALYYSIYDGQSWTTSNIPLGTSHGSYYISFIASDLSSGNMMITWNDIDSHIPYYSFYSDGTWSSGEAIPLGASSGAINNVTLAQGSGEGQFIAAWTGRSTHVPYCSIYANGTWTTQPISLGTSSGVYNDIYISQGFGSGELIATWVDYDNNSVYYSLYSGGTWAPADLVALGTSSGASLDVDVAYIPSSNSAIATWANLSSPHIPYSSLLASPLPNPPATGSGKKGKDRFALDIVYFNELQWTPSSSDGVTGYNILRNGTLIASHVTNTSYKDYNRPQNGTDVYTITSVNSGDQESSTGLQIAVN